MCRVTIFGRGKAGFHKALGDVKSTNPADLRPQSIFLLEFAPNEEETDAAAVNYTKQDNCSKWTFTC